MELISELCYACALFLFFRGRKEYEYTVLHNPQIAARGSQHYRVYKEETSGVARTHIEPLADADRIQEIAQMLSGADITPAAISNAKNLLHL